MTHPEFRTIPIGSGDETKFAVERNHNGEVHYLASRLEPSKIGKYSLDLAESTAKVLRLGAHHNDEANYRWLPWPSAHLPLKQVRALPGAAASL